MADRPACKFHHWAWISQLVSLLFIVAAPASGSELRETAIVRALRKAWPAVVSIRGEKDVPGGVVQADGSQILKRVNGMGTGVVIDPRGYIITNHHVVQGVREIHVTLADGSEYIGRRIARDPVTDIAIIKIDPKQPLSVIDLGTSSDLMLGETVVALGNAFGYSHTATRGIISALHRGVQINDSQFYEDLIQTDASINPGNSGGPLLNVDGQMIGLNVAVRAGAQGIGFAIPVDKVVSVATKLIADLNSRQFFHGITLVEKNSYTEAQQEQEGQQVGDGGQDDAAQTAERQPPETTDTVSGVVVAGVASDSPAEKAGLRAGDVIVAIGERKVERPLDFHLALLEKAPGDEVKLKLLRQAEQQEVTLTLAPLASNDQIARTERLWRLLGLRAETIPEAEFRQRFRTQYRGGLLITDVRVDSPAHSQGIQPGDVLVGLHIWETVTLGHVNYILDRVLNSQINPVKFYIIRNGQTYYGYLSLPEPLDVQY